MAKFCHIIAKPLPQRLTIVSSGGKAMRNIIRGFAVLGALMLGMVTPAAARSPLAVPTIQQAPALQQVHWDNCGPRCWEHRREARERALERERWARHW